MRRAIAILVFLAPCLAMAQQPYVPKFARIQHDAEVLAFDLCPKPEYPKSSLRNEETGVVVARFTVAPTGRVIATAVAKSSGFRDLDRAALTSLSRCRFRPGSLDGVPVQGSMVIQYVWTLE